MSELSRVRSFFQKNLNKINFFHIEMSRVSRLFQSNWQTKNPKLTCCSRKVSLTLLKKEKKKTKTKHVIRSSNKKIGLHIHISDILHGTQYYYTWSRYSYLFSTRGHGNLCFFSLYSSYSFRNLWLVPWTPWTVMRGITYADKLVSRYVLLWEGWRGEPAITDLN